MFRVSCLDIWWRHDIWISKMLKVDYLKNEKSFRSGIKSIFPCFASALFWHTKQTIKNAADTTFKYYECLKNNIAGFQNQSWTSLKLSWIEYEGKMCDSQSGKLSFLNEVENVLYKQNVTQKCPLWHSIVV